MTVSALLLSAALAGGCGSSSNIAPGGDAGTTTPDAAVTIGTMVRGTSQPCTEPHTICVNATMPANMRAGQPTKIQIDLYSDIPPTHPPEGIPIAIPTPQVQAGETVQLRMSDLGMTGSYFFLGLLFMPGGGDSFPVAGVDYIGDTGMAYPFTGAALNLQEPLVFQDFN